MAILSRDDGSGSGSGSGREGEAEYAYRQALTYRPNMAETHFNL